MTATDSPDGARPDPAPPPAITIYQIVAVVFLNSIGFKGARMVSTLYALELGADPFAVGLLLATNAVFPLMLAVYSGRFVDRYGMRVPFIGGLACITVGVFLPFLWPALPMLYVATAVIGGGFIFTQVCTQALTGALGTGEARTRNFNTYGLVVSVTDLIGPVLAGFAIDHIGHVRTYPVLTGFSLGALAIMLLYARRMPVVRPSSSGRREQRTADLWRDPALRRVFILSAVVISGIDLFQLYLPIYGHSVGLSASAIGLVLGAYAAAAFVVRVMLPGLSRRYGAERTLASSIYCAAAACMLVPFFANPYILGAISFGLGLGLGLGQPLSVLLAYNYSPAGRSGEALGLRIFVNQAVHVGVPVLFGAVGTVLGVGPVFWVNSACLVLGSYAGRARAKAGDS